MEEVILFENKEEAFQVLGEREIKKIRVGNKEYGINRFNNEIFVFDIACPHAAYDLTTGKTSPLGTIVCPWHNYQFYLSNGKESQDRCKQLKVEKVHTNQLGNLCFILW